MEKELKYFLHWITERYEINDGFIYDENDTCFSIDNVVNKYYNDFKTTPFYKGNNINDYE